MAKATRAEMTQRVEEVIGLLRKGFTRNMILQHAATEWGTRIRATDEILARARDAIQKEFEKDLPHAAQEIVASLDEIYEKAMYGGIEKRLGKEGAVIFMGDLNAAIQAKMSKAKLLGLLKTNIQIEEPTDEEMAGLTDDEIRKGAA